MQVEITDVFLRDGLQDEPVIVSTAHKLEIAEALVDAGLKRIEVASFVNPKRVPQMADAAEVLPSLPAVPGVTYTSLALNGRRHPARRRRRRHRHPGGHLGKPGA